MDPYTKRIRNMDDFAKLYAELKVLNRLMNNTPEEEEEILWKKKLVEERLHELMFVVMA